MFLNKVKVTKQAKSCINKLAPTIFVKNKFSSEEVDNLLITLLLLFGQQIHGSPLRIDTGSIVAYTTGLSCTHHVLVVLGG